MAPASRRHRPPCVCRARTSELRARAESRERAPDRTNQRVSWFENRKRTRLAEVSRILCGAVTWVTVRSCLQPAFLLGESCGLEAISPADFLNRHREVVADRAFGDRQATGD